LTAQLRSSLISILVNGPAEVIATDAAMTAPGRLPNARMIAASSRTERDPRKRIIKVLPCRPFRAGFAPLTRGEITSCSSAAAMFGPKRWPLPC
jgi:hypothetical protein